MGANEDNVEFDKLEINLLFNDHERRFIRVLYRASV